MSDPIGKMPSALAMRGYAVALFALISVALWTGFAFDTYFASDGAYYFAIILDHARFTEIAPARAHAEYLSQWPLVLGVKSGVTDLEDLEFLFGLGLWFPWFLGFVISLYATREKPILIFFYLLSLASLNLAAWSVFIGEHLVLLSLSWPILFFGLVKRSMNWLEQVLTLLLLVIHLRLYESAVITGGFFFVVFGLRMWFAETKRERWMSAVFALLAMAAAMIALNWILFPRDADNRSSFLLSMLAAIPHPYPLIGLHFVGLMFLGVGFGIKKAGKIAFLIPVVIAVLSLPSSGILAGIAFSTRTLSLSALPGFMLVAALCQVTNYRFSRKLLLQAMILIAVISFLHVRHLQSWIQFRDRFLTVLEEETGFVDPDDHEDLVHWGWTNTLLSYVWSEGKVTAVVLNPDDDGYQPFDPRTEVVMGKYFKEWPDFVNTGKPDPEEE